VFLMCGIESCAHAYVRAHGGAVKTRQLVLVQNRLQLVLLLGGDVKLGLVVAVNDAGVLGTPVVSLPVLCGGIVELKEKLDESFVVLRAPGERELENFNVACSSTADVLVRGILWSRCWSHETNRTV
jgi:hypothetical protein